MDDETKQLFAQLLDAVNQLGDRFSGDIRQMREGLSGDITKMREGLSGDIRQIGVTIGDRLDDGNRRLLRGLEDAEDRTRSLQRQISSLSEFAPSGTTAPQAGGLYHRGGLLVDRLSTKPSLSTRGDD